jgi:hypothetical protein
VAQAEMPASEVADLHTITEGTNNPISPHGLRQQRAKDRNDLAMAILNQALKGETLAVYIVGAESPEWPDGLAHLMMMALEERCNPSASMKSVNLVNELVAITCTKKADLTIMVDKILGIKARYSKMGVNNLITRILVAAPPEYSGLLVSEQTRLEGQTPGFTLSHIHRILKSHYEMMYGKAAVEATKLADKADKEVTLANVQAAKTVAGQRFTAPASTVVSKDTRPMNVTLPKKATA